MADAGEAPMLSGDTACRAAPTAVRVKPESTHQVVGMVVEETTPPNELTGTLFESGLYGSVLSNQ